MKEEEEEGTTCCGSEVFFFFFFFLKLHRECNFHRRPFRIFTFLSPFGRKTTPYKKSGVKSKSKSFSDLNLYKRLFRFALAHTHPQSRTAWVIFIHRFLFFHFKLLFDPVAPIKNLRFALHQFRRIYKRLHCINDLGPSLIEFSNQIKMRSHPLVHSIEITKTNGKS